MCNDHDHDHEEEQARKLMWGDGRMSRRSFVAGLGVALGTLMLPARGVLAAATRASSGATPTGLTPLIAAMHTHAAWSEQDASWRAQFDQASRNGYDVMWMTDHDHRAIADASITSLKNCPMTYAGTGHARQTVAKNNAGSLVFLVESADGAGATATLAVADLTARNNLRTGLSGTFVDVTFGTGRIDAGSSLDVVAGLSYRPAQGGNSAGNYGLRYRFEKTGKGYSMDATGRTGQISLTYAAGTTVRLDPTSDFRRLWPNLLAVDNGFVNLAFTATSSAPGSQVNLTVQGVNIVRTQSDPASVVANQTAIVNAYAADYPDLTAYRSVEISEPTLEFPHCNTFGAPQHFTHKKLSGMSMINTYSALINQVHSEGGLVSWNHPFGYSVGPVEPQGQQNAELQAVASQLLGNRLLGADILEVGYALRGQHDLTSHLGLWDTLSRNGLWLTGNGANDDHDGRGWHGSGNGFATGIWGASTGEADLVSALKSGRAYTYHPGRWAGGALDLFAGSARMGSIDVATATSRPTTLYAANLPTGSKVELVRGVVDYKGTAPVTSTQVIPASNFKGGSVTVPVDTTGNCFVRTQVRLSNGTLVGSSNPLWLLRSQPKNGIPPERRVA